MKRSIVLILCLLTLAACGRPYGNNLIFRNDSNLPVGQVELVQAGSSSEVWLTADGEPLGRGEWMGFLVDPDEGGRLTLRVYDEDCGRVLAETDLELEFREGIQYVLSLGETGRSLTLTERRTA